MKTIRAIDLFCGAGGSSWGARLAGAEIVAGFDAWIAAKLAFSANFPKARFYHSRLEELHPTSVSQELGAIQLILASPECTSHSVAKGNAERCERSRDTAFQVVRFAKAIMPRWIVVENVVSLRRWARYGDFKLRLERLGYNISEQVINSADFGVPQRRRRLFLLCDLESKPPLVRASKPTPTPAAAVIDMNGTYKLSQLRTDRRASATLERADRAIAAVGDTSPFLLVYYGSDKSGGWQPVTEPLRTITTLDRFALVKPDGKGHLMRMLQVPELKQAMGMPQRFCAGKRTRRESIQLIGNAVCPPVMRAIVRSLLKN